MNKTINVGFLWNPYRFDRMWSQPPEKIETRNLKDAIGIPRLYSH